MKNRIKAAGLAMIMCMLHVPVASYGDEASIAGVDGNNHRQYELRRFKKQPLQSVSITSGGLLEFDGGELNSWFVQAGVGTGIPLGSFDNILGVTPQVRIDFIDAIESIDIPESLYEFQIQLFYRRTLTDRLSFMSIVSPSIRSDLSTDDNAMRLFALGLFNYQCISNRLTISAGAVMLGRADLPILPALGATWTPNRQTKFDLQFPLTKLAYRISKVGRESETWTYFIGGLGGNTWAITRTNQQSDELSLRDYRMMFGIERLVDGGGRCFAESGIALGRTLEYELDDIEISLGNAAIIRAGWRY